MTASTIDNAISEHLYKLRHRKVEPCKSLSEFSQYCQIKHRRVRGTKLCGGYLSTVFLTCDHFGKFFETAWIVDDAFDILDRYRTHREALKGHQFYKALVKTKSGKLSQSIEN